MAEARLRAAEQEQRKTSTALSPSLDLVAQIGRERLSGSGNFGGASNASSSRAIGAQLTLPLYTGGSSMPRCKPDRDSLRPTRSPARACYCGTYM